MNFKNYIRDIYDFPEKGVTFKDITPLLKDAKALQAAADAMLEMIGDVQVDKVVGMESRGFLIRVAIVIEPAGHELAGGLGEPERLSRVAG